MMEFLINNWFMILAFAAIVVVAAMAIYRFFNMPTKEQLDNLREWLLGAVTEAEKELGGGTGKLKLRQVYDAFVARFPWLAKVISFATFSDMVDDALEEMREMLDKNEAVQDYVAAGGRTAAVRMVK